MKRVMLTHVNVRLDISMSTTKKKFNALQLHADTFQQVKHFFKENPKNLDSGLFFPS